MSRYSKDLVKVFYGGNVIIAEELTSNNNVPSLSEGITMTQELQFYAYRVNQDQELVTLKEQLGAITDFISILRVPTPWSCTAENNSNLGPYIHSINWHDSTWVTPQQFRGIYLELEALMCDVEELATLRAEDRPFILLPVPLENFKETHLGERNVYVTSEFFPQFSLDGERVNFSRTSLVIPSDLHRNVPLSPLDMLDPHGTTYWSKGEIEVVIGKLPELYGVFKKHGLEDDFALLEDFLDFCLKNGHDAIFDGN